MRIGLTLSAWLSLASLCPAADEPGRPLQTFILREPFGVSHPRQVIDFSLADPAKGSAGSLTVIGPDGKPVPHQLLSGGRLAVEADLPAHGTRTWKVYANGAAPEPRGAYPVAVTETTDRYEITNGLTGVWVPKPTKRLTSPPAPIQGLLYRGGRWTATGPNLLSRQASRMDVRFRERGPLEVVVEVSYVLEPPAQPDPRERRRPGEEIFYRSTVRVQAGQPSVLVEEDANLDIAYSLDLYNGLSPNQARYRGHHATSAANGREPDGRAYRPWHERPSLDAVVDLQYAEPREYRRMAVWDPWVGDSGWYWQLYDSRAPQTANLFGIFAGPSSRALGASNSGVNIYTAPGAVTDLVTQVDAAGNLHAVYQSGPDLFYVVFDPRLRPDTPRKLASHLINPDLLLRGEGLVSVVAFDPQSQRFVQIEGGANREFRTRSLQLTLPREGRVTSTDAYQARAPAADFLLVFGDYQKKSGALLFARRAGATAYSFRQWIPADGGRQVNRPAFTALPDGRVMLLFTDVGGYAGLATITPGALDFGSTATDRALFYKHRLLNFGSAIDPRTGSAFVADSTGALSLLSPSGGQLAAKKSSTPLGLPPDHYGQGPNRRSLAVDDHGAALAAHGGLFFLHRGKAWVPFESGNALRLAVPRVAYHPATGQFLLVGRREGKLALYAWKATDPVPRESHRLEDTEQRAAGIRIALNRWTPDARSFPRVRFAWGFFAGVKGEDLKDPRDVQPIARQMNLHAGINLNKVRRWPLSFPDPPQGYGALYMERSVLQRMIRRLQTDRRYYDYLYNAEPSARELIDVWADPSVKGIQVRKVVQEVLERARKLLHALVQGDGIYDMGSHYWHGGLTMQRLGPWIDTLLADERTTAPDRARLKAVASLFGGILWDNDLVPMFDGHGLNMGTANMPVQQQGYRDFYALFLAGQPGMKPRADDVARRARATLHHIVNEYGAEMGSPHYASASFAPTLNTFLQLRMLGGPDPFGQEERFARFADFYMNLLTPPEIRFGGPRKLISVGDGSTEASELFGPLATGFRKADPTLSARLAGAWRASGKPQNGFFGCTLLVIDEDASGTSPALASANFPGYYSVLRHGYGTSRETAGWFLNGDFYSDHRHADQGSLVLYALGVPLSIDWGSMYSPHAPGAFQHSMVLPESRIGRPWDADNPPLNAGNGWRQSVQDTFLSFATGTYAEAHFSSDNDLTWKRSLLLLSPEPDRPLLMIRDSFTGPQAETAKVWSMNLMAEGDVEVPGGKTSPPPRSAQRGQLPSAGKVFPLDPGVQRLGFRGQWGVDWDLYVATESSLQAHVGNWAHNWHPGREQDEFQKAQGRPFEERQHILRMRGNGAFNVLLLPYRRRARPEVVRVIQDAGRLLVTSRGGTTTLADGWYAHQEKGKRVLAALGDKPAEAHELAIAGGPAEMVLEGHRGTLAVRGPKGLRTLRLPEGWRIEAGKGLAIMPGEGRGEWQVDYAGDGAVTVPIRRQE